MGRTHYRLLAANMMYGHGRHEHTDLCIRSVNSVFSVSNFAPGRSYTADRCFMFFRWPARFRNAFRGLFLAWKKDWSLAEHLLCAVLVVIAGMLLRVGLVEWCLLGLCVGTVIGAELFNTALEQLAQAIDREHNPQIGAALDLSAAGVLVVAIAAAVVGATVFVNRLGILLSWWAA